MAIDIADTASRIPIDRYAALYNRLNRQLDDEGFALFAQPMRVGSFEFLCRGCLSAPTLAEALARASRFLRLVLPDLAIGGTACYFDGHHPRWRPISYRNDQDRQRDLSFVQWSC